MNQNPTNPGMGGGVPVQDAPGAQTPGAGSDTGTGQMPNPSVPPSGGTGMPGPTGGENVPQGPTEPNQQPGGGMPPQGNDQGGQQPAA